MRLFIFVCLFSLFLLLLRVMTSVCFGLVIVVCFLGGDGSLAWAEVAIQEGVAAGGSQAPVVKSCSRTSRLVRPHLLVVER